MNTYRAFHFPMLAVAVVCLLLLMIGSLALLMPIAWSLFHVHSRQSPIQADPMEIVSTFHSVVNQDDTEALLALFTKDAVVDDSGTIFSGRDEIQGWILHSPQVAGLRLTMLQSQIHTDQIVWTDLARNESDADSRIYLLRWVAVIRNSKIYSLTVSLLPIPDGK